MRRSIGAITGGVCALSNPSRHVAHEARRGALSQGRAGASRPAVSAAPARLLLLPIGPEAGALVAGAAVLPSPARPVGAAWFAGADAGADAGAAEAQAVCW
jgi:hypothetical protein